MLGKWIISQCEKLSTKKRKQGADDDDTSSRTAMMTCALDSIVMMWGGIKSQLNAPAMGEMASVFSFENFVAPILGSEVMFERARCSR